MPVLFVLILILSFKSLVKVFVLVCKSVSSPIFLMLVQRAICGESEVSAPCYQSLSFACSILAHSRNTLHESSKIFVTHALHVARIQLQSQA